MDQYVPNYCGRKGVERFFVLWRLVDNDQQGGYLVVIFLYEVYLDDLRIDLIS